MNGNKDEKKGYDSAAWMAANKHKPGGGIVYHNDPSKRDMYSGNIKEIYEPYKRPSTQVQDTSASSSKSSGWKK